MSDNLSIQGTLDETTVPDLFRSLLRSGETAIVSLDAVGRSDVIYFSEGRIISATSSDPDMGLAEILLRSGEIDLQQYDQALERLVVARRIGAVLVELGYLEPDALIRAVERQASTILLDALSYRNGNYSVEFTSELPDGIIALHLPTERLILDGVRRIDYWSLIQRGVGRFERLLEAVPGAEMRTYHLELTDEEAHILSLLAEPQTVQALCGRSYLPNFVTCRTVWGLLAVNLVQDAASDTVDEKRAAEESEYELEAVVQRYNTLFQTIFGLVSKRIGDHIYDFVDRVVRHLSPETMPYLSGMSLVNEARIDFDQLLTNLIASGSGLHAPTVHRVLNELLYGWIFEVKTEFGPAAEAQIVKLATSVRR